MLGSGTKFPPAFPPQGLAQPAQGAFLPGLPRPTFPPPFPGALAPQLNAVPGQTMTAPSSMAPMAVRPSASAPAQGTPAPSGSTDVLIMIRQGVAAQDKPKVMSALQMAQHLGTTIDPPIMKMLQQWLGAEIFASLMSPSSKAPPASVPANVVSPSPIVPQTQMGTAQPAQTLPAASFAKSGAVPSGMGARPQPLMLIRQGVASQDKAGVRYALRLALQEGTTIDKAVCDMLRQWLGENDEALNLLSNKISGLPEQPVPTPVPTEVKSQDAMAVSTAKASMAASTAKAPPTTPSEMQTLATGPKPVGLQQEESVATSSAGQDAGSPSSATKAASVSSVPKAARTGASTAPVIFKRPVLKGAAEPEPAPPPDLDASFDSFLQEIDTVVAPPPQAETSAEPVSKKQRVDAEGSGAPPPPEEDAPPPPPEEEKPPPPKPIIKAPVVTKKPEKPKPKPKAPTKDEWGRDIAEESKPAEKEAWEYMKPAEVFAASSFIDFNNF